MALTTLQKVKDHLGITGTGEDTLLNQLITETGALIKKYCKQLLEETTVTEYYSGNGTQFLVLRERPVQSITTIHEDYSAYYGEASGAFAASTLLTAGTDYALVRDARTAATEVSLSGIVVRIGSVWQARTVPVGLVSAGAAGIGNIKVVYVAGWDAVPGDLELAANMLVGAIRQTRKFGAPIQSISLDYFSVTLAKEMPGVAAEIGSIKQMLSRYKDVAV